jgi:hypothetical protein
MHESEPGDRRALDSADAAGRSESPGRPIAHGATATDHVVRGDRRASHRIEAAGLLGALGVTLVSAVFIVSFIGGLHTPGPRSVPIGLVGAPAQASRLGATLTHQAPGAFAISSYPDATAARTAIGGRGIDAALVPGPTGQHLLVASAVSEAETNAIIKTFQVGAAKAHVPLTVQDIRPLHTGDPEGLAQLFFCVALVAPSLVFGNMLISKIGTRLNEFRHLGLIALYAVIVAGVATAIADAGIGALTGAPWGIFGIGTLLAFASAVIGAAGTRWVGTIGYVVLLLLFVPVGISSSGSTLGPRMITPWWADVGKALLVGSAQPAVRNVTYFNSHAIVDPLLILSAWALAGVIALVLAAFLHPPMPGKPSGPVDGATSSVPAATRPGITSS